MRILITAQEAIDKGIWEEVADIAGYNYYAVKEGMDTSNEISLTEDEAVQLGLIRKLRSDD